MSIDKETIRRVARLARIKIEEESIEPTVKKLQSVMGLVEQLAEVDTDNVEPLRNVVDIKLKLRNDEITDGNCQEKVLANAPEHTQGFYVVPKVIETAE